MKKVDIKQQKIGGLRQNCFVSDCRNYVSDTSKKSVTIDKYTILEREDLPNGMRYNMETKDYPINSDTVTSYVDSADYHRDPLAAIANAPKRVNLGNISEVQAFVANNPQEAVRLYKSVGDKLAQYFEAQNKQAAANQSAQNNQGGEQ